MRRSSAIMRPGPLFASRPVIRGNFKSEPVGSKNTKWASVRSTAEAKIPRPSSTTKSSPEQSTSILPLRARKALAENWSGREVQLPEERDHRRARRTLQTRRRRVHAGAHDRPEEGRTEAAMEVDNTLIVARGPDPIATEATMETLLGFVDVHRARHAISVRKPLGYEHVAQWFNRRACPIRVIRAANLDDVDLVLAALTVSGEPNRNPRRRATARFRSAPSTCRRSGDRRRSRPHTPAHGPNPRVRAR